MTQILSLPSVLSLYSMLAIMALYLIPLSYWQLMVLKGKRMEASDGGADDWHLQHIHYVIAVADLFLWLSLLISLVSSWYLSVHTLHDATSWHPYWN